MCGLAAREIYQTSAFDRINPSLVVGIRPGAYIDYDLTSIKALCSDCSEFMPTLDRALAFRGSRRSQLHINTGAIRKQPCFDLVHDG
jgi:hypothetical protein